ncbi:LOW QUALITY PROTEIN: hypothetical protein QC761_505675 [Podospora bellae-mahoneyi]|uniref:Uncharacterized protein n=1 Tax=Podospora bellae-mahoneyi TaxID=2093777 RepID=A0ABR0FEY8_9PEZI|nr:LOW QUALITY PROTEIN: hypothetical protein QC761_505675 [Podospora bellae-mahoneyi]
MDGRAQRRVIGRPYVGVPKVVVGRVVRFVSGRYGAPPDGGDCEKEAMVKLHAGFSIHHRRLFGFQKKRRTAGDFYAKVLSKAGPALPLQPGVLKPTLTASSESKSGSEQAWPPSKREKQPRPPPLFLGPLNKSTETGETDPEIHGRVLGLPCRGEPLWSTLQDVINTSLSLVLVLAIISISFIRLFLLQCVSCQKKETGNSQVTATKRGNSVAHPVAREISLFPSSLSLSLFWRSLLVCLLSKLLHRPATVQAELQQRQDL